MIFLIFIGIIITLLILEIILRLTLGFHNPLLYIADREIGYLLAPNQQVRRWRNRVIINEYSLRSSSLREPKQGLRILLLGDSVLNGSWWTDQADTISEMIKRILTLEKKPFNSLEKEILNIPLLRGVLNFPPFFLAQRRISAGVRGDHPDSPKNNNLQPHLQPTNRKSIEILNVSANGWSPRNELAYLQKFGIFQADILVLLLNTDDLFGTAPTSIPVGNDRYYPSRKPALAILEAATRLLIPYTPPPEMAVVNAEGGDRMGFNLTALGEIYQVTQTHHIPLIITLTPLWHEVLAQTKNHETLARQRLVQFLQEKSITYLDFLPIFQNHPDPKTLYRDQIHLTPAGNQLVSAEISKIIVGQTHHANLEDRF